jgi:hypothetical protein
MQQFATCRPALAAIILRCCGVLVFSAAAAASAGCSGTTATTPSDTTSTASTSTDYFTGTLAQGGSAFYSFTVSSAGTAAVTLASTTAAKIGPAVPLTLRLGLGTPLGEACSTIRTIDTPPGLSAQLLNALGTGTYCVNVADIGNIRGSVLFAVRIVHS